MSLLNLFSRLLWNLLVLVIAVYLTVAWWLMLASVMAWLIVLLILVPSILMLPMYIVVLMLPLNNRND